MSFQFQVRVNRSTICGLFEAKFLVDPRAVINMNPVMIMREAFLGFFERRTLWAWR